MYKKVSLYASGLVSLYVATTPALAWDECSMMLTGTYTFRVSAYQQPTDVSEKVGDAILVAKTGMITFERQGKVRIVETSTSTNQDGATTRSIEGFYERNGCLAKIMLPYGIPPSFPERNGWSAYLNPMQKNFVFTIESIGPFAAGSGIAEKASWGDLLPNIP